MRRLVPSAIALALSLLAVERPLPAAGKMLGMYVHQHWPYNHPYAARTWTLEDWRGYAQGLKTLGYNTFMIWPVIETMPDPPTPSDLASLEKHRQVIAMLQREFGMKVIIALCPNVVADNAEAAKYSFEKRHFFYCDRRVNPADPAAVRSMMRTREKLLRPLAGADAFSIIDSDPGGYPGSKNADFINLLAEHRRLFDQLRPGIELYYWVHAGWQAYARFYETGIFRMGEEPEFLETLELLRRLNPEPWGLASGLPYARKLGLESRVLVLNYGRIEGEPSFPMTNFGGSAAYEGGRGAGGNVRGVLGNAQTHCVQLPNTFAFARGAAGLPLAEADYVRFAGDLIPGQGPRIVRAWQALGGSDAEEMRRAAAGLASLPAEQIKGGPLRGLLFGSPQRFVNDLILQLRMRAAAEDFYRDSENDRATAGSLARFAAAAKAWQQQHGYENHWHWPRLYQALKKLKSPAIDAVLDPPIRETGFERVRRQYYLTETMTPRLLEAISGVPTVSTQFEGGSIGPVEVLSAAHLRCAVAGESDQDKRNRQANWYYFELGNLPGTGIIIDLVNLVGEYNYRYGTHAVTKGTRPVYSYDRRTWTHFSDREVEWDEREVRLRLRFTPRQSRMWIAHVPPYTNQDLRRLLDDIRGSAEIGSAGKTAGGRDIPLVTVTNPRAPEEKKKVVWLMCRQHAWEAPTSYVCEGALRFLVSGDPLARRIRDEVVFKVFPMADPDGVARGGVRFNAHGYDLNRNWDAVDPARMPEIAAQRKAILDWVDSGRRIDLFLTLHNTESAEYLEGCFSGAGQASAARLFRLLSAKTSFHPTAPLRRSEASTTPGKPGRMTVYQGLYHDRKIPALLMEQMVEYNSKLGRLPAIEDRLQFGPGLVRALWASVTGADW